MKSATLILTVFAILIATASASPGSRSTSTGPGPIATVVRHRGLCYRGTTSPGMECRSVVTITDRWISAPGVRRRALTRSERADLLTAIRGIDAGYLRRHPFRGTCPTAFDGQESIYRFRGFRGQLASCTYDLRGVSAVTLVNRLIDELGR